MDHETYINAAIAKQAQISSCTNIQDRIYSTSAGGLVGGGALTLAKSPTIADQIEERLTRLQSEVDRVKRIKKHLSEPNGVLTVSVDDLRWITNY